MYCATLINPGLQAMSFTSSLVGMCVGGKSKKLSIMIIQNTILKDTYSFIITYFYAEVEAQPGDDMESSSSNTSNANNNNNSGASRNNQAGTNNSNNRNNNTNPASAAGVLALSGGKKIPTDGFFTVLPAEGTVEPFTFQRMLIKV